MSMSTLLPDSERILLGPGPSLTSPRVMRAMAAPTISHLDPQMLELLNDIRARLLRLFALAKAGRHDEARALQAQLMPLARLLGPTYGVPGLKAALKLTGFDFGVPRSPLAPVPDSAVAALREALADLESVTALSRHA